MLNSITIDLPDGADREAVERAVRNEIDAAENRAKRESDWAAAMECDVALKAWCHNYIGRHYKNRSVPMMRASTYGNSNISSHQEVWPCHGAPMPGHSPVRQDPEDPRRPVFMRGALEILIGKYSYSSRRDIANGWAERVIARYLRKKKYSCFSEIEHEKNIAPLSAWARQNFYLSRTFDLTCSRHVFTGARHGYGGDLAAWFNGTHFYPISKNKFAELRKRAAAKQCKAKKRDDQQRRRRLAGARPRAEYLAASISRLKPWATEGISRRSWYRKLDDAVLTKKDRDREVRAIARAAYELGLIKPGELL